MPWPIHYTRPQRWSGWLAMALLLFNSANIPATDNTHEKIQRLEQLRSDIKHLRQLIQRDYGEKNSVETTLRSAELKIAQHSRALKKRARQLREKRGQLRQLQQDKTEQQQALSGQQQALAQQMRASYAMGRQGTIKILLSAQDPAAIGRTLTYYKYFNQARAQRIHSIHNRITELEQLHTDIHLETTQLKQLVSQQQQQQQQRQSAYQQRHQVLLKLQHNIGSKEKQLQHLIQDKKRLARLLTELHKALADIPPDVGNLKPFGKLRGLLTMPTKGRISSRFGTLRNTGNLRWQGITIQANEGDAVTAIYHGRVAFADWLRHFGMLVIIDHGDGYMSLYAHNQALYRDVGEWVSRGDVIATIGNSGGQAKSGLYFEIRHNGTPTNPAHWIKTARK